jgi:tetratricopeptide (TPR) repeat protein
LVARLGYLPLAIHVAAGHLAKPGSTPDSFLRLLEKKRLALGHPDPADFTYADRARAIIATTFELSLETLRGALGADAARLADAFNALAHAPLAGFGRSLGAAIAGLDADDFGELVVASIRLSLLEYEGPPEHARERFWLHPLLAELLQPRAEPGPAIARMTEWFLERLPEQPSGKEAVQGRLWDEIQTESVALTEWLERIPTEDLHRVERAGSVFAMSCGPFLAWMRLCDRGQREIPDLDVRSDLLWTLGQVARNLGDLDKSLEAAREKIKVDRQRDNTREIALAQGLIADVLQARGQLDEALRIRQEEELPTYERLGDVPDLIWGRYYTADNLLARNAPDDRAEAIRLLNLALADARAMRLPETGQIEGILRTIE